MRKMGVTSPRWSRMTWLALAAVLVAGVLVAGVLVGAGRTHGTGAGARSGAARPGAIVNGQTSARMAGTDPALPPFSTDVFNGCATAPSSSDEGPISGLVAGWSDASKLGSALTVGYQTPALAQAVHLPSAHFTDQNGVLWQCFRGSLSLDYQGKPEFPPTSATFLAFGFMPVTATIHLIQVGPLNAVIYQEINRALANPEAEPFTIVSTAQVSVQVTNVKVNGVPLDVGNDCHTGILTSPGNPLGYNGLVLAGGSNVGDPGPLYQFGLAGSLTGTAKIPPFTGCVTPQRENVDALLASAVSGPSNFVRVDLGPQCLPSSPHCVPPPPTPNAPKPGVPVDLPFWTVSKSGTYSATAPLGISTSRFGSNITCNSTLTVSLPNTSGPPRGDTGTTTWAFTGCEDQKGNSWTVTQEGPTPFDAEYVGDDLPAGVVSGRIPMTLDLTGPDGCTMQIFGPIFPQYAGGTLTITTGNETVTPVNVASTCPSTGQVVLDGGSSRTESVSYTFNPLFEITNP